LGKALVQAGFAVDHVADGVAADQLLRIEAFALLVLDIGPPRLVRRPAYPGQ
jgi:two-component system response regulator TctD